jgi:hypothetical protein
MLTELWSNLRYRLRALFRRSAMERELDAELRDHLEREVEKLERTGSTASSPTAWCSGGARSACAWRWARRAGTSSPW